MRKAARVREFFFWIIFDEYMYLNYASEKPVFFHLRNPWKTHVFHNSLIVFSIDIQIPLVRFRDLTRFYFTFNIGYNTSVVATNVVNWTFNIGFLKSVLKSTFNVFIILVLGDINTDYKFKLVC